MSMTAPVIDLPGIWYCSSSWLRSQAAALNPGYKGRAEERIYWEGEDKTACHARMYLAQCLRVGLLLPSHVRSSKREMKPSYWAAPIPILQLFNSSTFKRQSKWPQPNQCRGDSTHPAVIFADPLIGHPHVVVAPTAHLHQRITLMTRSHSSRSPATSGAGCCSSCSCSTSARERSMEPEKNLGDPPHRWCIQLPGAVEEPITATWSYNLSTDISYTGSRSTS